MRRRGGGHKHHYRQVDFNRDKDGIVGRVERLEYDPNRSAHIALVLYADGERRYIIAPKDFMQVLKYSRARSRRLNPAIVYHCTIFLSVHRFIVWN